MLSFLSSLGSGRHGLRQAGLPSGSRFHDVDGDVLCQRKPADAISTSTTARSAEEQKSTVLKKKSCCVVVLPLSEFVSLELLDRCPLGLAFKVTTTRQSTVQTPCREMAGIGLQRAEPTALEDVKAYFQNRGKWRRAAVGIFVSQLTPGLIVVLGPRPSHMLWPVESVWRSRSMTQRAGNRQ